MYLKLSNSYKMKSQLGEASLLQTLSSLIISIFQQPGDIFASIERKKQALERKQPYNPTS